MFPVALRAIQITTDGCKVNDLEKRPRSKFVKNQVISISSNNFFIQHSILFKRDIWINPNPIVKYVKVHRNWLRFDDVINVSKTTFFCLSLIMGQEIEIFIFPKKARVRNLLSIHTNLLHLNQSGNVWKFFNFCEGHLKVKVKAIRNVKSISSTEMALRIIIES